MTRLERKVRRKCRKERMYYIEQKLCGIVFIVIGIILAMVDNDITFTIISTPFGLYLMFTSEKIITFYEDNFNVADAKERHMNIKN